MSAVVGIDLGTSNSVVAWGDEVGNVKVLADRRGNTVIPSVIAFLEKGSVVGGVLVGAEAKEHKVVDPKNTIYSFKRLMGQTETSLAIRQARSRVPYTIEAGPDQMPAIRTCAGAFSPVELSAVVLDHLREIAVANIQRPVNHAVITVPANFNDAQRSATANAGAIAGLQVVRVLNEPTAAALAYGNTRRLHGIIAVYDFGGGTFDLTILKLEDQHYTVLGTAGDSFLGGDDIDERIVDRMVAKVIEEHRIDLRQDMLAMMRLRSIAEWIKIELSTKHRVSISVDDLAYDKKRRPVELTFEFSSQELISLISDLVERTMSVTQDACSVAQVKMDRVSDVILVGGTTRIPYIRNRVAAYFEKAVRADVSPQDAVAVGAALQAASLEEAMLRSPQQQINVPFDLHEPNAPQPEPAEPTFELADPGQFLDPLLAPPIAPSYPAAREVPIPRPGTNPFERDIDFSSVTPTPLPARQTVIDVTPSSFGVGTAGGYCELLIRRSTPLPITVRKKYATVREDQDMVRIVVCQGETRVLAHNTVLGDVVLTELPRLTRGGVEIEVSFELDTSGMLHVSARDAATGKSQRVVLDLVGRMDEGEVAAARDRVQKLRR